MSRRLPTDAQGVRMNVLVGGSGSDAPPAPTDGRSRHCYAASIGNDIHGAIRRSRTLIAGRSRG